MTEPRIHRAFAQLPEQQRADIALVYWSGLSHGGIAVRAHLEGAVAAALQELGAELLAEQPQIERVDAFAVKLP